MGGVLLQMDEKGLLQMDEKGVGHPVRLESNYWKDAEKKYDATKRDYPPSPPPEGAQNAEEDQAVGVWNLTYSGN